MKHRVICALSGLLVCCNALAYDISEKFYFGVNFGATAPFYKSSTTTEFKRSDKKLNVNLGLSLGQNLGQWSIGADIMVLNAVKYTKKEQGGVFVFGTTKHLTQGDLLIGLNGSYNFFTNNNWICKTIFGIAGIKSVEKKETITNSFFGEQKDEKNTTHNMKLAPQIGLSTEYLFSDHFGARTSINYLKPINHPYLSNVLFATIGLNVYI